MTEPARLYEFGVKTSIVTAQTLALPTASCFNAKALPGNPYDGHTLPRTPPPSLELMDAARSYEHGRDEHADAVAVLVNRRRCPDPSPSCSRRTWHRQTLAEAWRSRASKLPPLSAVILNRGAVQNRATAPQAPVATWLPPWARSGPPFWAVNLPMQVQGLSAVRECAITSNSHALC
jgi:hypothetical protein